MKRFIIAIAACFSLATPLLALEAPKGPVILTVKGKLAHPNSGADATFDLAMLNALKGRSAKMETPWTEGKVTFSGPLLRAVLDAAGAPAGALKVRALNDYAVEVPASDAREFEVIIATKLNGKPMSVRDKGPTMLVYPFDLNPKLYTETYFSRSVWQIKDIEILP
jgi:hypothetical protein